MNKNLGWKLIIIVAAVLLFVYGIFGVPAGLSGDALANALVSPSAMRHGIPGEDIRHAIDNTVAVEEVGDDPVRWLVLGLDRAANLLIAAWEYLHGRME